MPQATTVQQTPPPPGYSASEMLALKRGELRDQLKELSQRRNQLSEQRSITNGAKAAELDARIAAIDARSAQLEQQLFATNDQINSNLTPPPPAEMQYTGLPPEDASLLAAGGAADAARQGAAAAVFSMLALYALWRGFRRFVLKPRPAVGDNSAQLSQLQQSIDVIALEVERISEAQRYTAKMMNERAIGAGEAEAVVANQRQGSRVK